MGGGGWGVGGGGGGVEGEEGGVGLRDHAQLLELLFPRGLAEIEDEPDLSRARASQLERLR